MAAVAFLSDVFRPVVDLIYPPRCPICGSSIADQTGLCVTCWSELVILGEPSCASCSRPLPATLTSETAECAECLRSPPEHDGISAGTLYNDASRQLILRFKHGRKIAMSSMLARLILARLPETEETKIFVPVPRHWSRLWQRGFNQSALLARELADLSGGELLVDGLLRKKRTPALGGLGKTARARVLSGAIALNPRCRDELQGRHLILVDDVLTSGSTSAACVKVLKRAGAERVTIACVARVLNEAVS